MSGQLEVEFCALRFCLGSQDLMILWLLSCLPGLAPESCACGVISSMITWRSGSNWNLIRESNRSPYHSSLL